MVEDPVTAPRRSAVDASSERVNPLALDVVPAVPTNSAGPVEAGSICPYLVDVGGPWRRSEPAQSHRCRAVSPAAAIPTLTQKRLCLSGAHDACPTFRGAVEMRAQSLLSDHVHAAQVERSRFAAMVRPLPLALPTRSPRSVVGPISRPQRRRRAAAVGGVVAVMVAGVVGSSVWPAPTTMTAGDAPVTARATLSLASHSPGSSNAPARSPTPSPFVASPPPSSPAPVPGRRYIVREGDRLRAIARRFETTVEAILVANDLRGRRPRLVPGQTLDIPAP